MGAKLSSNFNTPEVMAAMALAGPKFDPVAYAHSQNKVLVEIQF